MGQTCGTGRSTAVTPISRTPTASLENSNSTISSPTVSALNVLDYSVWYDSLWQQPAPSRSPSRNNKVCVFDDNFGARPSDRSKGGSPKSPAHNSHEIAAAEGRRKLRRAMKKMRKRRMGRPCVYAPTTETGDLSRMVIEEEDETLCEESFQTEPIPRLVASQRESMHELERLSYSSPSLTSHRSMTDPGIDHTYADWLLNHHVAKVEPAPISLSRSTDCVKGFNRSDERVPIAPIERPWQRAISPEPRAE